MLERSLVGHELLDLMLGEVADAQFAAANECTAHRLKLAGEQPRQGRLAVAVAAYQRIWSSGSMRRLSRDKTGVPSV